MFVCALTVSISRISPLSEETISPGEIQIRPIPIARKAVTTGSTISPTHHPVERRP